VRNFGNPMTVLQVSFDLGFPLKINLPPNGVWAQPSSYSVDNNFLYRGQSRRGVNLTTHLHLIPILKMSGFMLLIPSVSSWTVQGEIYLYLYSFLSAPYSSVISCWYIRPVWGHGSRGLPSVTPLLELKIFRFNLSMPLETADWKTKDSELNVGRHFPNLICS
jgi:hypothetical protein